MPDSPTALQSALSGDGAKPRWDHRVYRDAPINKRTAKPLAHLTALLYVAVLALLIGAATAGAHSEEVVTVAIRDFYFEPSQLIVEPGTTFDGSTRAPPSTPYSQRAPLGHFALGRCTLESPSHTTSRSASQRHLPIAGLSVEYTSTSARYIRG